MTKFNYNLEIASIITPEMRANFEQLKAATSGLSSIITPEMSANIEQLKAATSRLTSILSQFHNLANPLAHIADIMAPIGQKINAVQLGSISTKTGANMKSYSSNYPPDFPLPRSSNFKLKLRAGTLDPVCDIIPAEA